MGYAISAGAGLLVGIGFLIWALRERSARQAAEKAQAKAEATAAQNAGIAENNVKLANELQASLLKEQARLAVLNGTVRDLRGKLVTCKDPQTVKTWLDAELKGTLLLLCLALLPGCCWMAKRDCFPACPPPTVVNVAKPCALPGPLELPAVQRTEACPKDTVCFDIENAAKLAVREGAMRDWILQAKAVCAPPSVPEKKVP